MTAPSLTAQRRAEEKEQRRQSILDAAAAVVARKGVDALTMGDVAREARLSRGLVYFYFKDKLDLFDGLAHRAVASLADRFRAAASAHTTGLNQIYAIGRAYVQFSHECPVLFEALARFETRELDPSETDLHEAATLDRSQDVMQVIVESILRGQADGSIRPGLDPMKTSMTLWGFTHGMIQVGAMKEAILEQQFGFDADALLDHAFETINLALAPD
ncbi:MAG: TetR/AcrR family transcriptional regulator [Bacteroidota bacterium]